MHKHRAKNSSKSKELLNFCWQLIFDSLKTGCLAADQALELFYARPVCKGGFAHQQLPKTVSAAALGALVAGGEALLAHEAALQRGATITRCAMQSVGHLRCAPCMTCACSCSAVNGRQSGAFALWLWRRLVSS